MDDSDDTDGSDGSGGSADLQDSDGYRRPQSGRTDPAIPRRHKEGTPHLPQSGCLSDTRAAPLSSATLPRHGRREGRHPAPPAPSRGSGAPPLPAPADLGPRPPGTGSARVPFVIPTIFCVRAGSALGRRPPKKFTGLIALIAFHCAAALTPRPRSPRTVA
jgi:hypothetical protein